MAATPFNQYLETKVNTAPPVHLVVMLYDALLKNLRLVERAMAHKDVAGAARTREKAFLILEELMATVNPDAGEVAANLLNLYEFSLHQILQAQLKDDPALMQGPILVVDTLRDAWASLAASTSSRAAPGAAATRLVGEA